MSEVVRKAGLAMKVAKRDLRMGVDDKIERFLREHSDDAYTINGLLVEVYGVEAKDLRGPWAAWPGKLPTLYGRVRRVLDKLYVTGKLTKGREGKATFWAWKGN